MQWNELDDRVVTMLRALAADAVQKVGNGHPGTAMALAPAAYLIFQKHLRHNPANATWQGRDRFVLSVGHSSLTLYSQLFTSGYGLTLDDLQRFRSVDSLTPAHPEYGHTVGVETTTGPLGQGVANAVGMAMAAKYRSAVVASEVDSDLFDYTVYCLAGDGCLQEGISAEASSLAGHLKLNNLILIYDDNKITIDGATDVSFTESVVDRYRAYGWNVLEVAKNVDGSINVGALNTALEAAKASQGAPTLIRMESEIAWPAPKLRNTAKSHGSALGADEVAATKRELGLDPTVNFFVDEEALAHARKIGERGAALEADWNSRLAALATTDSGAFERWLALSTDIDLDAVRANLPSWEIGSKVATRKASQRVLNALAPLTAQLLGGSADLSESNGTWLENQQPMSALNPAGRNIHFGIREHAMGGVANGLTLAGLRPYVATFLVFSDYMRASVRLSALMDIPTTYVWTHDSIGLGEDGPTHQPVEHLASLRLIPNFAVVRPADGNETAAAWHAILTRSKPAGLVLSRQDLTTVTTVDQARNVARGGYVVRDVTDAHVTLIATGSELELALAAAQVSEEFNVRVVSMPCVEWFLEQEDDYQASVLPAVIPTIAIEAGSSAGWYKFVGRNGAVIGLDQFGASAAPDILFERNGFSVAHVLSTIRRVLS